MYLLSIHIHEYLRILLTQQRIFAINVCTNANISFEVLVNIHIREYIFVALSTSHPHSISDYLNQSMPTHWALGRFLLRIQFYNSKTEVEDKAEYMYSRCGSCLGL